LPVLDPIIERRNAEAGAVMGLGEHLEELRSRVIWALIGLAPILIIALVYGWTLVRWMIRPALDALAQQGFQEGLQITSALESFSAYFYVVVLATVIVGGPWIVYQIWRFVAPGLYSNERRFAYILAPLSMILAIAGVLVMYFGMLPVALTFLITFGTDELRPPVPRAPLPAGVTLPTLPILSTDPDRALPGQFWINRDLRQLRVALPTDKPATDPSVIPSAATTAPTAPPAPTDSTAPPAASEPLPTNLEIFAVALTKPSALDVHLKLDQYVDLFVNLTLVFAIAFQVPVVMLLLGWSGLVNPGMLARYRKHALAGSVIIAAVVSPTGDPISLAVLQLPLYLLYELGLLLMKVLTAERIAGRRREPNDGDE
jgi:sec-independent protein translocase protein TatC